MKELIKKTQETMWGSGKEFVWALSLHIFTAFLGFVASRGVILGSLMPFGLAFVGGCDAVFLPGVAIGSFVGYFIPAAGSGGFRYISTLLAIVALRLFLSGYKKLCENPIFLGVISTLANAVVGVISQPEVPFAFLKLAAECIIIFGSVFMVHRSFAALQNEKSGFLLDSLICIMGTVTILIIGASRFLFFDLSLGRIFGVFMILVAARYGGAAVSSTLGIAISLAAAVTGAFEGGFGIYAFAGLAAGLFVGLGKYAQSISVLASGIIGLSFMQFKDGSMIFITEIIIGSIAFLLIPRSLGVIIGKFFYQKPYLHIQETAGKSLSLKLNLASDALLDVSDTVTQVSQELGKINAPDFKAVLSYIEQDACAGCKLRLHCWESKNAATTEAIMKMINIVKGCDDPKDNSLDEFRGRCLRVKKMEDAVQNRYSHYASLLAAENRIDEVRQVVSEQFEGISGMLHELSRNISTEQQFDPKAAEAAVSALKNIGIHTLECAARVDKFGRLSLEMKLALNDDTVLNRLQIMKILSLACERDFSSPNISKAGEYALLVINEQPNYRIDIGIEQRCAVEGSICGDAYKCFNDGKGHFIMILSDGMGTGGRAAVDGAMASGLMARLLKAGFGYDCSLKILNSSMLFKSSDESLATMDIASIDLFTGTTELYKAGAAPTLVRRNGRTGRAESHSLPIGILKDVSFDKAGIKLKSGDILLLASDGVTFDGTEWIRQELENWRDGGAQDLAEHICDCARRRYHGERHDDITVIAAIVERTV